MNNLLHYPQSVIVNRTLPKKVFYDHLDMSTKMRQHFTDDIASLTWLYKLGAGSVNVPAGKRIVEMNTKARQLKREISSLQEQINDIKAKSKQ